MKINLDIKRGTDAISGAIQKTSEISRKGVDSLQENAKTLSERIKADNYLRKLKKYNPIFPEQYHSNSFSLPNMIVIVDDAVRREIDVCEGSMGWLANENGMEVLYLYDEAIESSGLQFIPAPICDSIYFVDRFDRNRFIQTDCIFSKAHDERLAELKHIAYSLGAKRCTIEIIESDIETKSNKNVFNLGGKGNVKHLNASSSEKYEKSLAYNSNLRRKGKIIVEFEGSSDVKPPVLKWFAHDDNINRLIEMRSQSGNQIKSEELTLEGTSTATMSQKTAQSIDSAISKIGIGGNSNMEGKATREHHSKLSFRIDF